MCGIAGLIYKGKSSDIGQELTSMLQALKHRGPDSTGFALYGHPKADQYIMRFKVAEQEDVKKGFEIQKQMKQRKATIDARMAEMGAKVEAQEQATDYAYRYVFSFDGDLRRLADYIEDIEGAEILSLGHALETLFYVFKVAEQEDVKKGFEIQKQMKQRKATIDARMAEMGAKVEAQEQATDYAYRYVFSFDGDLRRLADYIEDIEGAEILSLGHALELIKDLGDANRVSTQYGLDDFEGTHAIGHTRMATESDVDIRSAHPYWAYPFNDVSVVHNGQLTNYWNNRRALERRGHRFMSNCDSELIAVYLADSMDRDGDLEESMHRSISELDGVFTYVVATQDRVGMAKDVMAAKPMVLYESDDLIALASEEVAIRSIFPHEIDTYDPYEGEVRVWQS